MLPEKAQEFKDQLSDFFGAIDFQGSKLTGSGGKDIDKKWYRAFRSVH